jgi:hypothetical protein
MVPFFDESKQLKTNNFFTNKRNCGRNVIKYKLELQRNPKYENQNTIHL